MSNSISWMASNALRPCTFSFVSKRFKVLSSYFQVTFNHVRRSIEDALAEQGVDRTTPLVALVFFVLDIML